MANTSTSHNGPESRAEPRFRRLQFLTSSLLIYAALVFWAFISLFPIYWTITTSFKTAVNVTQGHLIPFVDFTPDWKAGARSAFRRTRYSWPRQCATNSCGASSTASSPRLEPRFWLW